LVGHLLSAVYVVIFALTLFAVVPACAVMLLLGIRATRQAERLAADYLKADEYIHVNRISSYTISGGPERFDRFLMNVGIPLPDGVTPRPGHSGAPLSVRPNTRRSGRSAWASIRDAVPRRTWIISLSGAAVIGVGIALDLVAVVLVAESVFAGRGPAAGLALVLPLSVVLFIVGAALMHSYVRAVRRRD
jgi:hypothetical protein